MQGLEELGSIATIYCEPDSPTSTHKMGFFKGASEWNYTYFC